MEELATRGLVTDTPKGPQDYASGGIQAGRGLLEAKDNFNSGINYGDQAMSQAIKQKFGQKQQMGERRMAQEMRSAGQNDYLKKLQVVSQMADQEHQINVQKRILREKQEQAKKAARGAMVGQVLGIAGAVGGAMIPGAGAAGAVAGYQVGNAAGNAVGGM